MSVFDPTKIRVRDSWVVVLMDERKVQLSSGLFLPASETGVEKVTEGMGTLVRVGDGKKNALLGIACGSRVALRSFLKYANPIPTDEKWPSGEDKEYFIMNVDDLIGVLAPGVEVGVFSRPSQSAVESVDGEGSVKLKETL